MMDGPLWADLSARPRSASRLLSAADLPTDPGVYAWFHEDTPVYVGVAAGAGGLRQRVGKHLQIGNDLSRSSLRRNVSEFLSVASTARTRIRPTVMTADQVAPINKWISECEVSWISCESPAAARGLEAQLKFEWKPLLTKR